MAQNHSRNTEDFCSAYLLADIACVLGDDILQHVWAGDKRIACLFKGDVDVIEPNA